MNKDFFDAVKLLVKEKGLPAEHLYEKIRNAIIVAASHDYGKDNVFCDINPEANEIRVYVRKTVVSEIEDPQSQILPDDAQKYKKGAIAGDIVEIPLETKEFGRIAAQKVKHVLRQGIKEVEQDKVYEEFQSKNQEIVTARVQGVDPRTGNVTLEIGNAEAILPRGEQVPGEEFTPGELIKVYIVDVHNSERGPKAMISRTHPGLVKRLFEAEVPEIYDGIVEIKGIAREAGSRTKIAVYSKDENIDPSGACIGARGARVGKIVELLGGEKIDIVKYSDEPRVFIANALAPAEIINVDIEDMDQKI
ncbi:MAG: transcription termination/antitermination protein NusA, partial [Clostridiales bacterium]|nr:transcription termination/antitermination protein NusA [Clostridiales bacterium]